MHSEIHSNSCHEGQINCFDILQGNKNNLLGRYLMHILSLVLNISSYEFDPIFWMEVAQVAQFCHLSSDIDVTVDRRKIKVIFQEDI